jgi:hypothetical protein
MPPVLTAKRNAQIDLGNRIAKFGKRMVACSCYEKAGRADQYIGMPTGPISRRCSECSYQGRTYDFGSRNKIPEQSDWDSLDEEIRKIDQEMAEAAAKIARLNTQKAFLKDRERKMYEAGYNSLDELNKHEERERLEKEQAERAEQAPQASSSSEVDPSIFELPPMSDSELAAWLEAEGSFGGISPNPVGSSGS